MRKSLFRFKKFDCHHGSGSMKIGVDAVLVGAWADVSGAGTILDVGTGCGVIALMCAQRNESARVYGIDVDAASVAEAEGNFCGCPWHERLEAKLEDFNNITLNDIDLIISNPPYFESGVIHPDSPRMVARHKDNLSPEALLTRGCEYLSDTGRIAMIVPSEQYRHLLDVAHDAGLVAVRAAWVRGHLAAPVKRVLIEFSRIGDEIDEAHIPLLTLENVPGEPTDEHRVLCRDFYLKF